MIDIPNSSPPNKPSRKPILTNNRLRMYTILATLTVAAIAVIMRTDLPALWAFLGIVVTALIGQSNNER